MLTMASLHKHLFCNSFDRLGGCAASRGRGVSLGLSAQIILREEADWVREHREWQEQFQRRTRKQYPAEFWDKSRRGKVLPAL